MVTTDDKAVYLKGLTARYEDHKYPLDREEFLIGRSTDCHLIMEEETISSQHARITVQENNVEIIDLDSANGTFVNGERITRTAIRNGDTIAFDQFEFQLVNPADVSRTVMAPLPEDAEDEEIGKTMVRPTLDEEEEQGETTVFPAPPETEPTVPEAPAVQPAKARIRWPGIILGLIVTFLIGYGSLFVLTWAENGFSGETVKSALASAISIYPFKHLHPIWTSNPFTVEAFLFLLCLLLALLLGGLTLRSLSGKNRLGHSALFALFYIVIALLAQLAAMKLNFSAWSGAFSTTGVGLQSAPLNILVSIAYFWIVSFILSLCGSLLSNK
jgi:hypothetical protein